MEILVLVALAILGFVISNSEKQKKNRLIEETESLLEKIEPTFEDKCGDCLAIYYDKNKCILRVKYTGGETVSIKDIKDVDMEDISKPSSSSVAWIIRNGKDKSLIYVIADKQCYHIVKDFNATKIFSDTFSYMAIDMDSEQIVSVDYKVKHGIFFNCIGFKDIIKVETTENGNVVSSKSAVRTIGGAVVGNAIAGGAGMVVGGLSGDATLKKKVLEIVIRVTTRNIDATQFEYRLYLGAFNGVTKDDDRYVKALSVAQEIENIIGIIIDKMDNKTRATNNEATTCSFDVADELKKLAELKNSGILTEEEFQRQKSKLLS